MAYRARLVSDSIDFIKEANFFGNVLRATGRTIGSGLKYFGNAVAANPLKSLAIGAGVGAGLGFAANSMFSNRFGTVESAARRLVEAVIRKDPSKYFGLTSDQKEKAIRELASEFSADNSLKQKALSAAEKV